nr:hypothetical protein [Anabaena sp. UHCC 0204]
MAIVLLYKGISSQMAQENPEDVTKLVKTIEENTQKVLGKTNTKAQS